MGKEDKKSKDVQHSPGCPNLHDLEARDNKCNYSILHIPAPSEWNKVEWHCCGGLTYIIFGVLTILLAIIEIIVSSIGAATKRYYETPHASRLVAIIVLAVVAVVAIAVIIYAIDGVRKKHTKPLHTTSIVLVILVIIQALITGVSVNITDMDEIKISQSLSESFSQALDGDTVQEKLWDMTQSGLECCGVYSPEDYRDPSLPFNFPPNIPASCCPSTNTRNVTSRDLDICKANGSYYKIGCKLPILDVMKATALGVIAITVLLIIAEVLLCILGAFLSKKRKDEKHENIEVTTMTKPAELSSPAVAAKK